MTKKVATLSARHNVSTHRSFGRSRRGHVWSDPLARCWRALPPVAGLFALCLLLYGCKTEDSDDLASGKMALKFVLQSVDFPHNEAEYTIDLNDDGKGDNGFYFINQDLSRMGQDMEAEFYEMFQSGSPVFLVEAASAGAGQIKMLMHYGEDEDGDPEGRFSGTSTFKITADSPSALEIVGSYSKGNFDAGPGDFKFPVPKDLFFLSSNIVVDVTQTHISAKITDGEIIGQINACIAWSEVEAKILPSVAEFFTNSDMKYGPGGGGPGGPGGTPPDGGMAPPPRSDGAPPTPEEWEEKREERRQKMLEQLDTDGDGVLSVTEIQEHPYLKHTLKPDVDLDGDSTNDCVSFGVGFSAVTATW